MCWHIHVLKQSFIWKKQFAPKYQLSSVLLGICENEQHLKTLAWVDEHNKICLQNSRITGVTCIIASNRMLNEQEWELFNLTIRSHLRVGHLGFSVSLSTIIAWGEFSTNEGTREMLPWTDSKKDCRSDDLMHYMVFRFWKGWNSYPRLGWTLQESQISGPSFRI